MFYLPWWSYLAASLCSCVLMRQCSGLCFLLCRSRALRWFVTWRRRAVGINSGVIIALPPAMNSHTLPLQYNNNTAGVRGLRRLKGCGVHNHGNTDAQSGVNHRVGEMKPPLPLFYFLRSLSPRSLVRECPAAVVTQVCLATPAAHVSPRRAADTWFTSRRGAPEPGNACAT